MFFRPLVYLTLAFAAGIALAGLAAVPPLAFFPAALAATAAGAVIFLALGRNSLPVLVLAFFLLGAALAALERVPPGRPAGDFLGRVVTVQGYICRDPDFRGDRTILELEVESLYHPEGFTAKPGRMLVYIPGRLADLGYGDAVRAGGRAYLPDSPDNPGQFDYREYLSGRGIQAVLAVREAKDVEKTASGRGNPVARAALGLKQRLMEVNRATLEPGHAALVNGIVFGSRGGIDPGTSEVFNEAGVVHILSVSGLHVGLVAAGVLGLLALLGLSRAGFPVLTAVLAVYTYMTGLGPAVMRSALMAWVQLLGHRLGRERDWPTTLAVSALVILAISPRSLFDPGFQLSFAATWGILHLGPAIDRRLESLGLGRPWVRGCLSVPLGAQLGTFPLVVYYFNIFSLISLPANLLAVPLVGLILPLGILASLAGLVYLKLALLINYATAALLDLMMLVVEVVHGLPGGVIYIGSPPLAAMAAWYLSLAVLAGAADPAQKVFGPWVRRTMGVLLVLSVAGFYIYAGGINRGLLEVHVIDVGQGDSLLLRFPNGRNLLVDAGGWQDEYREGRGAGKVVADYLRRLGVRRLDALVLTHPHEDHAAGAIYLNGRFEIGALLVSPAGFLDRAGEQADPAYRGLLATAAAKKTTVRELFSGDMVLLDPRVRVEVLGPRADLLEGTRSDFNNNSLVLSVRYGQKSFLLTGDIELEGQARLLEGGAGLRHSVLKMPHHGSRYLSPEFLDRVQPEMTVISVGVNSFGQPDPGTVSLAGAGGRPVYRTDRHGLVVFSCDGGTIRVSSYKPGK